MEFQKTNLGELSVNGKGSYGIAASAVPYSDELFTYLRITDINDDGTLNKSGLMSVSDEKAEQYLLKPNDIVFARTGGSTGRSYFYDGTDGEFVYAGFLIKFSIDSTKVNPRFIKYYCLSQEYRGWVHSFNTGSTRGNINAQTYANMPILLPSREQQDLLVDTLSVIDEKIKLNTAINENLEQQAQALFKAWFVDFEPFGGVMPDDWSECILDSMCSLIIKGITPKYNEHSAQLVINQKCVRNHQIDLSLARCHEPKKVNEKWLQYGDIVVNSTGTGTLGRAAQVLFTPNNMTVDSHVTIIRTSKQEYIYYLGLWATSHEHDFEMLQTGSTGQTDLPRERLKQMQIVLPSDSILSSFSKVIKPIADIRIQKQQENQRLSALRDTLLPKLMNGEIRRIGGQDLSCLQA